MRERARAKTQIVTSNERSLNKCMYNLGFECIYVKQLNFYGGFFGIFFLSVFFLDLKRAYSSIVYCLRLFLSMDSAMSGASSMLIPYITWKIVDIFISFVSVFCFIGKIFWLSYCITRTFSLGELKIQHGNRICSIDEDGFLFIVRFT